MNFIKFCLALCLATSQIAVAQNPQRQFLGFTHANDVLEVVASDGRYLIRPHSENVVETSFVPNGERRDPVSHALVKLVNPVRIAASVREDSRQIELATAGMVVSVEKQPFRISYSYKGKLLIGEKRGYHRAAGMEALEFALSGDEALYGAGARAVGMNRRGHRFKLYNRAHYGYGKYSEQLNFAIPMVLSSKKYAVHFDNPQVGYLDLDSGKDGTLRYEAGGGRKVYQVIAGDDWAGILGAYTGLTGRQPLPPRWVLGNFSSRFGYKSEAETRATVDKFIKEKIPLDAIVLDLFWFGKDIKGTMGNLDWDRDTFPRAEQMMADFKKKGVKTVVVTEPFILTTSKRWQEAVDRNILATGPDGRPYTYDFFFGNTGLIDLYKPEARDWFWSVYKGLRRSGVTGWWGDLGEPEVHPSELRHVSAAADEVHNVYGHDWARLIAQGYDKDFPEERPFILMRAGYSGSQRYGLIPWSGDVARDWGGLQSQVEIALQMGMQGMAYMHSDLGGFAGAVLDDELYVRWLQYGVFQPLFRPHAQADVPPEPVYRNEPAKSLAREAIRLRYAMLPYNYTIAFDNSRTGMPLMRPLLFEETDGSAAGLASTYLWGPNFLVAPVVEAGALRKEVYFPVKDSVWFDFHTDQVHRGGITELVPVVPERIPVFVRAGAFVPMAKVVQTTRDYSTRTVDLHYYHHANVSGAQGELYDDDGQTSRAYEKGKYEIVRFESSFGDGRLEIRIDTETGKSYRPMARTFGLKVHNVGTRPSSVTANGRPIGFRWDARRKVVEASVLLKAGSSAQLAIGL